MKESEAGVDLVLLATLIDWLEKTPPDFVTTEKQKKPIAPCALSVSLASSKLQEIARNSDWLTALFAPVLIGWGNCFGIGFSRAI